jgi:hypothetical protein
VENGVACYLVEGFLLGVFCLGWELRELVRKFYRRAVCKVVLEVRNGGHGVGDTRQ